MLFKMTTLAGVVVVELLAAQSLSAGEPQFRRHEIDASNTLSAAAAIDVDRDGRLDIVTGSDWYKAPDWRKHSVREVEFIRGRYDDYACQPLDVNDDGWIDFVIANYRSQKLGWVENPGKKSGPWAEHVVARPGPMETGRLVDVDGDGRLDILPNGRDFAAWWEIPTGRNAKGEPLEWIRHDLPSELIGHGVGCGDVNGDGRADLVGAAGWLEAPVDRRAGRWLWHADFQLGRDASVPIVVCDVDEDGDADIVYGRGHRTGVYWVEQIQAGNHRTAWQPHAIDTSWSQAHTVELADLDGDGRAEVVTGKRYLAHDGRDIGEWDPLVIYAYRFDRKSHTFERQTISGPSRASFDVDPKLVDLDGDGDCDVLAPGRSGLFWIENLLTGSPAPPQAVQLLASDARTATYRDHRRLLVYADDAGGEQPVKAPGDWGRRRADILKGMERAMGELPGPERRVPLDVRLEEETRKEKYTRRKINFAAEPGDRVPAYLLIPHGLSKPAAAMLCLHQTTAVGKDEPAGLGGRPSLHYAHELAERGFVCLVPDYPSFGDYQYDFEAEGRLPSGSMKAIWNNLRALDLLESLKEVDRDRLGCIGHSLGGHNGLFTAAFDERIRAVVTSCGFTPFHDYYGGKLAGWTSPRYMPRIKDVYGNDPGRVPFDFYEVLGAIAPRAVFISAPERDANFDVSGVKKAVAEAGNVYALFGAGDRLKAVYPDSAHDFPEAQRDEAYAWLKKQLK